MTEVVVTTGVTGRAKFQLECHQQQTNAQFVVHNSQNFCAFAFTFMVVTSAKKVMFSLCLFVCLFIY